jgi:hypothetical protein
MQSTEWIHMGNTWNKQDICQQVRRVLFRFGVLIARHGLFSWHSLKTYVLGMVRRPLLFVRIVFVACR